MEDLYNFAQSHVAKEKPPAPPMIWMQAWLRLGEVALEGTAVGVGVADVGTVVEANDVRSISATS